MFRNLPKMFLLLARGAAVVVVVVELPEAGAEPLAGAAVDVVVPPDAPFSSLEAFLSLGLSG